MSYDSWLQDYDGYLKSLPSADFNIKYDNEEKIYMVFENGLYLESFDTEDHAETYIKYLQGE